MKPLLPPPPHALTAACAATFAITFAGPVFSAPATPAVTAQGTAAKAAGAPAPRPLRARPARQPAPPAMRLDAQIKPQAYALALTLDPAQPSYSGNVTIALLLAAPKQDITLHAKDLTVTSALLASGAQNLGARLVRVDAERLRLHFARPLPAGPASLSLAFTASLQDKDVYGFFRQRDGQGGPWLAISQFEATGARLAFPLFDEPGWKVPWTVSLTVPEPLMALSNTPVLSSTPDARPGWKTVQFQPTPPLPSYLLALAVGEFELREAGSVGQLPLRFITPRGRSGEADYAASVTGRIVSRLEDYFGLPFPYAKLDSLAIPVTVDFGAMEHPGLVTYASKLLLARPGEQTREFQREYVVTAAHELAHQWFGNLVTMAWWDDLWLNESFASWLEVRITDEVMPQWGWALSHQRARAAAMHADRLVSARRIQQPVATDEDMGNLFDAITYQKGQTVLAMFEGWLGEQRFRDGVRRYMQRHAWGHARGDDFIAALAEGDGSGSADATLPGAMRSFIGQPGIPLVKAVLDCPAGGPSQLRLTQSRLLPLGSTGAHGPAPRWQIPLLVRTPAGNSRLLLADETATLALPDASCPAWVQANAGGAGYYRVAYDGDGAQRLAAAPGLSDAEAMALLDDAGGLHEAGALDSATLLALVQRFAAHPRREVVIASATLLGRLNRLVAPAQRDAYAARWQAAFGDRARTLGWLPRDTTKPAANPPGQAAGAGATADSGGSDDGDDSALLRRSLLPLVADLGQDSGLRAEATQLARGWLADHRTLGAEQRGAVLAAAALDADAALLDALLAALHDSSQRNDRNERHDLLHALGQVRAPALAEQARAVLLDPRIDIRESLGPLLGGQAGHAATQDGALAWLRVHQAALAKRLGRDEPGSLPTLFTQACSQADRQALAQAFGPGAKRYQGGQVALDRRLEAVGLCSAWRTAQPSGL